MYKVIKFFVDLQDNNHSYNEGDIYPRNGLEVSNERIAELTGSDNKQGEPLIVEIADKAPEKAKRKAKKTADN